MNRDITARYLYPQEYFLALLTLLMVALIFARAIGVWKNQIDITLNPVDWRSKLATYTGTEVLVIGLLFLPFGVFQGLIGHLIGIGLGYFDGHIIILSAKILTAGIAFYEIGRLFHVEKINTQQIAGSDG